MKNPTVEQIAARVLMVTLMDDCAEPDTGELNCTLLAERTADTLGHDAWLDDSDHWILDLAVDVSLEEWEKR